jgi:hypothetical protein
MYQIFRN